MVPTFSYRYGVKPVEKYMPVRNGISDYSCFSDKAYADTETFDVISKEISVEDMGAFAKYILDHDKSVRGNHPLNSFTALGALAQRLVSCQTWQDVYAPFEQLYDDNGYVLLIGVGLCATTAIHYAEQRAGRTPFIRWAYNDKKNVMPVSVGSCSRGFEHFNDALENFAKKVKVANSEWTCYNIKDLVDVCKQYIEEDPRVTHCGDPYCDRCNDAVSGGPVLYGGFWA